MFRNELLTRLNDTKVWDMIIVGGGATGLGAAVDAAARGYTTLLVEADDFAKGTSSRSTKLVHGGVRYLAQGNISLVREALHERGLLRRNAPHLVGSMAFVVPAYNWWSMPFYGIGLTMYDVLAGRLGLGASRPISHDEAIRRVPTLEPHGLMGGILYYDGQFDDARLAVSLMRTFLDLGGTALNHAPVIGLLRTGERIRGVRLRDELSGNEIEVYGKVVVNATGVFVDRLRQMDDPKAAPMLSPSQGVHIVLDKAFIPGDTAIMIPRTDDGRVLFAIPWHDRAVVGTTDTPVDQTSEEPRALPDEIAFLISHARRYLARDPSESDVLSIFAGLRPLVKAAGAGSTAALSRDHTLVVAPSGLVTVTGGKWTTYRHMADDTVTRAAKVAALPERACTTSTLRLRGWVAERESGPLSVYGADAAGVLDVCNSGPGLAEVLHPRLPYLAGEIVWAARHELAITVEDVLARRLRALLLDARASIEAAPRVAELLAAELGFDAAWQQQQIAAYRGLAQGYLL